MNKTVKFKALAEVSKAENIDLAENQPRLNNVPATSPSNPIVAWDSHSVWRPFIAPEFLEQKDGEWTTMIHDLLHNLDEIATMLHKALQHADWLNAFLLAAGMNQIIEDYLHPDPLFMGKAAQYLGKIKGLSGKIMAISARTMQYALTKLNQWTPETHKVVRLQHQTTSLVETLAGLVMKNENLAVITRTNLVEAGEDVIDQLQVMPASLRSEVIRLPSCFQSFDQQPEDIRRIIEIFSLHWPDPDRPLYVIGIRTSGSYLAPLYAAMLKQRGYRKVTFMTLRPGKPLTGDERKMLRLIAEQDGLALLCDDPPITGSTITQTAEILERNGILSSSIILLLQLFGDSVFLPAALHKYPSVLMTWNNWTIQQRLSVDGVKSALVEVLAPAYQINQLEKLSYFEDKDNRQHVCAVFRVSLLNPATNELLTRLVQVKGIGLGYFGEHVHAISRQLPGYSPEIIAIQAGLTYREILPESRSLAAAKDGKEDKWISHLVSYTLERNRRLPARVDTSLQLYGRNAAWEVASNLLSQVFGRAWLVARLPLVDPYVKAILRTGRPSIIDGDMSPKNWYLRETIDFPLMKLNPAERDFSHMDLFSYDPVFDLAGIALEVEDSSISSQVRCDYEALSGEKISPERWVLYRLVHLWDIERQKDSPNDSNVRRMAGVVQSYFEESYFRSIKSPTQGPLCALDVDGVLETNQLEFPSLTTSSARSLRALALHGYRVILATGRSVEEVKDRCAAYHLAGGIAEYGAVLYDHASGQIQSLLNEDEVGTLNLLRARLGNTKNVYLDPEYHFSLRAYQLDRNGKRSGLGKELIRSLLGEPGIATRLYAIEGQAQTDFMVLRVDKGLGVKEWLTRFDRGSVPATNDPCAGKPISLAVGDSSADIPMLSMARLAFVPQHAGHDVRIGGVNVARHPYQRGFEQAVTALLGHEPGSCPTCQMGALPQETQYMLDLLSIQQDGSVRMLSESLRLLWRKARKYNVSP